MMYWSALYDGPASRHEDRARHWEKTGKPEFAAGSRRKAARWREKRRELEIDLRGPYPKDALGTMRDFVMDEMAQKMAQKLANEVDGAFSAHRQKPRNPL